MKEFLLQDTPDVSVVIPCFNSEKWVGQTIISLLNQSYRNFELIVVDDGSTDNSKRVIDQFSYDRRVSYHYKSNGGCGSALNIGHRLAKGKYLTWCSADNIYYPPFLETLRFGLSSAEQQGHNVQLIYSDFHFIDEANRPIRLVKHTKPQRPVDLIEGYDVGMSFMYTKRLWEQTGPYWNRICEDYHFVVRAAQFTNFALVGAPLAGFRVHGDQISGHRAEEEKAAADECRALARKLYG